MSHKRKIQTSSDHKTKLSICMDSDKITLPATVTDFTALAMIRALEKKTEVKKSKLERVFPLFSDDFLSRRNLDDTPSSPVTIGLQVLGLDNISLETFETSGQIVIVLTPKKSWFKWSHSNAKFAESVHNMRTSADNQWHTLNKTYQTIWSWHRRILIVNARRFMVIV